MRALAAALMLLTSAPALAGEPEPSSRLMYTSIAYFRYNPIGLQEAASVQQRWRLVKKEGMLWDPSHVSVGAVTRLTPAFSTVGAQVQVMPLAMLQLRAAYEGVGFYGTFNQVHSYSDTGDAWDDDTLSAAGDAGLNYPTTGGELTLEGRVQAKVSFIAIRSTFASYRWNVKLKDGATAFYDQTLDVLAPNKGWVHRNDLDVLYAGDRLSAGVRWTWTNPVHNTNDDADMNQHRVGAIVAYAFKDDVAGAKYNKPTLFLLPQWHVVHPYRAGQQSNQAIPTFVVGFGFNGDIKRKE